MQYDTSLLFVFLFIGLVLGASIAWLYAKFQLLGKAVAKDELQKNYVLREVHDQVQEQADLHRDDLMEKEAHLRKLTGELASRDQALHYAEEKLQTLKQEIEALQLRSRVEFENISNRLLDEKSLKFGAQNQQQMQELLSPLREQIKVFEDSIEKKFVEETKERSALKKEIEMLRDLNQQLSQDAGNLANALKGDSKKQGDWGEFQLELLLERAGLVKDLHYRAQASFRDDDGQLKRPDFVIYLPEGKHLIIDSKVSLTAYERFFNAEKPEKQEKHLKEHVDSLRQHINDLNSKNYQSLYQINTPDYLLLFVPIEPAFNVAVRHDARLFTEALDKNIVLVTTSTLLATMRTISYIWKQEKQKRNVLEIARQGGLLYDKFCAFTEDLKMVGQRIESAQGAWHDAMNKLVNARRHGDTLIGRAEKIRELGARTSRQLPPELLESGHEEEEVS